MKYDLENIDIESMVGSYYGPMRNSVKDCVRNSVAESVNEPVHNNVQVSVKDFLRNEIIFFKR